VGTVFNILIGIVLGLAAMYFLVLPTRIVSVREESRQEIALLQESLDKKNADYDALQQNLNEVNAERQRLAEEAEQRRLAREEAERQRRLAEEAEQARLAEEAERRRLAEEAERQRLAEEAEKQRRIEEMKRLAEAAEEKTANPVTFAEEIIVNSAAEEDVDAAIEALGEAAAAPAEETAEAAAETAKPRKISLFKKLKNKGKEEPKPETEAAPEEELFEPAEEPSATDLIDAAIAAIHDEEISHDSDPVGSMLENIREDAAEAIADMDEVKEKEPQDAHTWAFGSDWIELLRQAAYVEFLEKQKPSPISCAHENGSVTARKEQKPASGFSAFPNDHAERKEKSEIPTNLDKQKPAESEEDEEMISSIEQWLHEEKPEYVEKELAWLEALRNRLKKQ
jgi:hypothetical protein